MVSDSLFDFLRCALSCFCFRLSLSFHYTLSLLPLFPPPSPPSPLHHPAPSQPDISRDRALTRRRRQSLRGRSQRPKRNGDRQAGIGLRHRAQEDCEDGEEGHHGRGRRGGKERRGQGRVSFRGAVPATLGRLPRWHCRTGWMDGWRDG